MKLSAATIALLAVIATPAMAHGTFAPGEGFVAGVLHPVLAISHLIVLLALGLLLGKQEASLATWPLAVLAVGLTGALLSVPAIAFPAAISLLGLIVGILVLVARPVPVIVLAIMSVVIGVAVGSDTDMAFAAGAKWAEVIGAGMGVIAGVFLIVLNSMALARLATHPVGAVAVRVGGSWVAAASIMVLALQLRPVMAGS